VGAISNSISLTIKQQVMKKGLFTMAVLALVATAHAQTEKGDWLAGGNFALNTAKNNTVIGFTPMAGVFVINNLRSEGISALLIQRQVMIK
jgi:hypothetical protein